MSVGLILSQNAVVRDTMKRCKEALLGIRANRADTSVLCRSNSSELRFSSDITHRSNFLFEKARKLFCGLYTDKHS